MNPIAILFSPLGRWLMVLVAFGALVGLNQCTAKDRDHWKKAANDYKQAAEGWRNSFDMSEARRKTEQGMAVGAINAREDACDVRVNQARASARTIRQIVTREVPRDPQGCPVRAVVPTGDLRNALQPPGASTTGH
jgi:hypothetical protein